MSSTDLGTYWHWLPVQGKHFPKIRFYKARANGNPHPSILTWKIPCTEEPGGLQTLDLQRVRCDWVQQQQQQQILVLFLTFTSCASDMTTESPEWSPPSDWKVLLGAGVLPWSFILSFRGHCPVYLKHPPTLLDSQPTTQRDTKRSRGSRQKQVTTMGCSEWLPPTWRTGRLCVLVVSDSSCSKSNSNFTLAICLRWATLLSLWAYSPAYKMGVTYVLISIKPGDT